ncbi:MAG TPA: ComEC/Rec2 family competence protein [Candidatus Paceibacterota bacterium]
MTSSQTFLYSCLSIVAGIGFASFWDFSPSSASWRIGIFLIGVLLFVIFWKKPIGMGVAFCVCAAALGIWRYQAIEFHAAENAAAITLYAGEEAQFQAKVVKAPEKRLSSTHVVVRPEFAAGGRILLTTRESFDIRYGDVVTVRGKLERPGVFEDFNYEEFLEKDGIYAVMREPALKVEQRGAYENVGERAMAVIFSLKTTLREGLEKHLSVRHGPVMVEMLLGDKDVMSDELAANLNVTGLRHVIAISGAHIAILTMYLMPLLIWLGLWRQQAFYVTLALVIFYVVLTGLQPSALRAGVMGSIFLVGQHVGRQYASLRALVFAATAMLLFNPFLLARDVGFQLSFLAVLGMIVLLPVVLSFVPKKIPGRQLLGMTIAAQIFTFPVLIWSFGQVSLVSILTNILIVPLAAPLMGLGFLLMIGGLIQPFGFLLSLPVALLLQYVLWVVDVFSAFPFATAQIENLSIFWLVLMYIPIGFFWWKFRSRREFPGSYLS